MKLKEKPETFGKMLAFLKLNILNKDFIFIQIKKKRKIIAEKKEVGNIIIAVQCLINV